MECWLHDEDVQLEQSEQLELEGRLEVSVEKVPVVDVLRRGCPDCYKNKCI